MNSLHFAVFVGQSPNPATAAWDAANAATQFRREIERDGSRFEVVHMHTTTVTATEPDGYQTWVYHTITVCYRLTLPSPRVAEFTGFLKAEALHS